MACAPAGDASNASFICKQTRDQGHASLIGSRSSTAHTAADKGRHAQAESARARKILPAGALLVEWEPDPERDEDEASVMWLVLHPDKWNKEGHLAWRWHPDELEEPAEPPAKRARGA